MKICTECLVDLLPSLENPANDGTLVVEALEAPLEVLPSNIGIAQPLNAFALLMRDRFPGGDDKVVRRVGDAIWRRRQRLRANHKSRTEIKNFARTVDKPISKPVVELQSSGSSDFNQSEESFGQRSRTTKSSNTAPSIFDHKNIFDDLDPAEGIFGKLRHRESVSSFRSSLVTNASKSKQRRTPVLPIAGRDGAKFECFVCLKTLGDIKTQEQWKKHVFDDLEPYICQFGDCDEAMSTFKSKREWTNHEMTKHRDLYDDLIQVSRCPLCLLEFIAPKKALYRHLGRHLRELSLASLPSLDTTIDEEVPHLSDQI
ncbi:hypothetical protein BKA64DRAFT_387875 [Cadophora sp. MPI-SDFR-AT-0126]|nr:hypothetical protein BKA64DRAFT_387875 [Leotiomycetes sp. MPI-SDFR-AT-0126]